MDNGKLVKVEMMPREGEPMLTQDHLDKLRMLLCSGMLERLAQCAERIPNIESAMSRVEVQCRAVTQRCDASDLMFQQYICPGNVNFSQRTLDEYSDDAQVNLEDRDRPRRRLRQRLPGPPHQADPADPQAPARATRRPRSPSI
jgi:hypothetical protein